MASQFFTNFFREVVSAKLDATEDTLGVLLVSSVPTESDFDTWIYRDDITNEISGTGYTAGGIVQPYTLDALDTANNRQTITLQDITGAWTGLTAAAIAGVILYKINAGASTDMLIQFIDNGSIISPSSEDINLTYTNPIYINGESGDTPIVPPGVKTLFGWGSDSPGSFGLGNTEKNYLVPTGIQSIDRLEFVDSHGSVGFINTVGNLYVSGPNDQGQLGLGDTTARYAFTLVPGVWKKIQFGVNFCIALKVDGTMWHAGAIVKSLDGSGRTTGNNLSFYQIGGDNDWTDIALGYNNAVALKADGTPYAWGNNNGGQCATGTTTATINTPTPMLNGANIEKIACTGGGALCLDSSGVLWTCGQAYTNGLGVSGYVLELTEIEGYAYSDVQAATSSVLGVVVAILTDNTAQIWGYPITGCPDGTYTTPHALDSGNSYQKLVVSRNQGGSCGIVGIQTDGTLWGQGSYKLNGQDTTSGVTDVMEQIGTDSDWTHIAGRGDMLFAWK